MLEKEKLEEICRCVLNRRPTYLFWIDNESQIILRAEVLGTSRRRSATFSLKRFHPQYMWGLNAGRFRINDVNNPEVSLYIFPKKFNFLDMISRCRTYGNNDMWLLYLRWLHSVIGKCICGGIDWNNDRKNMEEIFRILLRGCKKSYTFNYFGNLGSVRITDIIELIDGVVDTYKKLTGKHIWFKI